MPTYRVTYRPGSADRAHELVEADDMRREGVHIIFSRDVLCVNQLLRTNGVTLCMPSCRESEAPTR